MVLVQFSFNTWSESTHAASRTSGHERHPESGLGCDADHSYPASQQESLAHLPETTHREDSQSLESQRTSLGNAQRRTCRALPPEHGCQPCTGQTQLGNHCCRCPKKYAGGRHADQSSVERCVHQSSYQTTCYTL